MLASASATPMRIRGTLIDSTIFHTSDQLMESIVDVLFQFRNPASQSQISSLTFPVYVSIDAGRRRPEGSWEPPPPIQPHGRPCVVGPRPFCRIACTICQSGQAGARMLRDLRGKSLSPTASLPGRGRARGAYAGAPRRYQPRHRRWQSQGMHEGPAPSRGPGPVTLSTGSPISVRGASPLRGRRRRRLAGRRARWQLRCLRQCWQACCLQCSCRPWAAPAQESAGTARQ